MKYVFTNAAGAARLGPIEVATAAHADGTVSVSAWQDDTGRRVGYLARRVCRPAGGVVLEVDPAYAAAGLTVLVEAMWLVASGLGPGSPAPAEPEARFDDMEALRGLQWLLAELGEHHELAALAREWPEREPRPAPYPWSSDRHAATRWPGEPREKRDADDEPGQ